MNTDYKMSKMVVLKTKKSRKNTKEEVPKVRFLTQEAVGEEKSFIAPLTKKTRRIVSFGSRVGGNTACEPLLKS